MSKTKKDFKILLVNTCTYRKVYVYPIGLDYVKSYLEHHGYTSIDTLDLALLEESQFRVALLEKISGASYDLIAFSFRNVTDQLHHGKQYGPAVGQLIAFTRQVLNAKQKNTTLVIGGTGFSLLPEHFIQQFDVDYGISGEGEAAILAIVNGLFEARPLPKGIVARAVPLKDIQYTRGSWGHLDHYREYGVWGNIQSKRGCNRKCVYCSYPVIEGKLFRLRDPENVAQEARQLEELGFEKLYFVDATFNNPLMHAKEILKAFLRHKVTAEWRGFFNPDIDQELLDLIKATNGDPVIKFTIESGSNAMLESLKKGFTTEYIERAIRLCQKNNMKYAFTVMFGAPGETQQTVEETCQFIAKLKPDHVSAGMGVFIYPKTTLAAQTKDEHWHTEEELLGHAFVPFQREVFKPMIEASLQKAGIDFIIYDELQYLNQRVM